MELGARPSYCRWVLPRTLHFFEAWMMALGSLWGRIMWRMFFLTRLWKEWNMQCLEGKISTIEAMVDRLKYIVAMRTSSFVNFKVLPLLLFWWVGRRWLIPPFFQVRVGLVGPFPNWVALKQFFYWLKANYYGSAIGNLGNVGSEGTIRDCNVSHAPSHLVPVSLCFVNYAELLALGLFGTLLK